MDEPGPHANCGGKVELRGTSFKCSKCGEEGDDITQNDEGESVVVKGINIEVEESMGFSDDPDVQKG